jgi:hypothetical protein
MLKSFLISLIVLLVAVGGTSRAQSTGEEIA